MLKAIGDLFSKAAGNLSKNVGDLLSPRTATSDPKSFIIKKGFETLFERGFGGGQDMGLVDTRVAPPKFNKSMGFYTAGMAKRSNMMGMQGKVVDADMLSRMWLSRLREYQKYTKFYT
jgi:hypothetical protein